MAESSLLANPNLLRKRRKIDSDFGAPMAAETDPSQWRSNRYIRQSSSTLSAASAARNLPMPAAASSAPPPTGCWRSPPGVRRNGAEPSSPTASVSASLTSTKKHKRAAKPAAEKPQAKKPALQKRLLPLQRKVKVLSRLVPGCRKVSLSNLLEETSDYIAARKRAVRAGLWMEAVVWTRDGGGDFTQ